MKNYTIAIEKLLEHADKKRAEGQKRYFKTAPGEYGHGDLFVGVCMPDIRKVAKDICEKTEYADLQILISDKRHEVRMLALIILVTKYERACRELEKACKRYGIDPKSVRLSDCKDESIAKAEKERENIVRFYFSNTPYINNWDLVDQSAYKIVGEYYMYKDKGLFHEMSVNGTLWEKRISIVSAIIWVKNGITEDFIRIAERLMNSNEDLLQKATGWVLREMGKKDREKLICFLQKNKYRMGGTAYSYATEHLRKDRCGDSRWKKEQAAVKH